MCICVNEIAILAEQFTCSLCFLTQTRHYRGVWLT